jgi:hypothetical protein
MGLLTCAHVQLCIAVRIEWAHAVQLCVIYEHVEEVVMLADANM